MRKEERDRNKARRDGLVARVQELEAALAFACVSSCDCRTKTPEPEFHVSGCKYKFYRETLNRQPRQSLDLLRVEVLEWVHDVVLDGCDTGEEATNRVYDEYSKLRNKAEQS